MCGRFALDSRSGEFLDQLIADHIVYAVNKPEEFVPRYNIKPSNRVATILHSSKMDSMVLASARWGYVPNWAASISDAPRTTFNARSESAMNRESDGRASMWRTPLTNGRRCIIPATGYYEWTGPKKARIPHWIYPADTTMGFAGLYNWWTNPALPSHDPQRMTLTATMLTMPSVAHLAHIHDRNPLALPVDAWWLWLDPHASGSQELVDAMVERSQPLMSQLLEYEVAPLGAQGDGPVLIHPVHAAG